MTEFPINRLSDRTSKAECIKIFEIAKSSFYEILSASQWLEDFENDYPVANGKVIRRAKLSKYQAWVIFLINQYRINLGIPLATISQLLSSETDLKLQLSKQTFIETCVGEIT